MLIDEAMCDAIYTDHTPCGCCSNESVACVYVCAWYNVDQRKQRSFVVTESAGFGASFGRFTVVCEISLPCTSRVQSGARWLCLVAFRC